jgi:hypothetical protein
VALALFTCSSNDPTSACPTPMPGSPQDDVLAQVRRQAGFGLLYPCYLPNAQVLESATVQGIAGRQQADMVFDGPFDLTLRQSQFPPAVAPDPAGASRRVVNLFPNVRATFIERNDGTSKALYHLFWETNGLHYEVQAFGPALQSRAILQVARSLQ